MSKKALLTISLLLTLVLLAASAFGAYSAKLALDSINSTEQTNAGEALGGAFAGLTLAIVFVLLIAATVFMLVAFVIKLIARAAERNWVTFFTLIFDVVIAVFFFSLAEPITELSLSVIVFGISALAALLDVVSFFAEES